MKRRWVDACRHCGVVHGAAGGRSWRRWYKEHLASCGVFQRASRARPRFEGLAPFEQVPAAGTTWPWLPEDLEPLPAAELGVSHAG
jgi:hypothetical protein